MSSDKQPIIKTLILTVLTDPELFKGVTVKAFVNLTETNIRQIKQALRTITESGKDFDNLNLSWFIPDITYLDNSGRRYRSEYEQIFVDKYGVTFSSYLDDIKSCYETEQISHATLCGRSRYVW
jgi:hypothetical protein